MLREILINMLLIKHKLFYQLIGIVSFINQIEAQPPWVLRTPTYTPTYTPTAVVTDVIVTNVPSTLRPTSEITTTLAPSTKSINTITSSSAAAAGGGKISVENLSCPQSYSKSIAIDSTSTLSYSIVLLPDSSKNGIFCGKLTSDETTGWIGLGISPNGQMANSVAIVGLPNDNTVLKYALGESRSVNPMSAEQQTLRDTTISQLYGATVMTFTKVLVENDELPILINGDMNYFIHARGASNSLGYHAARMSFMKSFGADDVTVVTPPSSNGGGDGDGDSSTMGPTPAPSKMASSVDNTPTVPPSTMDPLPAPVPSPPTPSWNDRPYSNYTSSPIDSNSSALPPTTTASGSNNSYGDNGYDFVLPGESNNNNAGTVSSIQGSPTSSGISINLNGLVLLTVALISSYFVY